MNCIIINDFNTDHFWHLLIGFKGVGFSLTVILIHKHCNFYDLRLTGNVSEELVMANIVRKYEELHIKINIWPTFRTTT